jgi:hypothetical protein
MRGDNTFQDSRPWLNRRLMAFMVRPGSIGST